MNGFEPSISCLQCIAMGSSATDHPKLWTLVQNVNNRAQLTNKKERLSSPEGTRLSAFPDQCLSPYTVQKTWVGTGPPAKGHPKARSNPAREQGHSPHPTGTGLSSWVDQLPQCKLCDALKICATTLSRASIFYWAGHGGPRMEEPGWLISDQTIRG